jgi:betaine-aldehyde dehydrogenase/aminobutyraldehyde dehydrogenase
VLNVVTGDGVPVIDRLVRHPDVRLVSLTGAVATGKLIAANAAQTLKRVHLELGGKAPMVVLDDADPAQVAGAIKIGGYWNSGQDCTASSRVLVSDRIYDDVVTETVKAVEAMKVGDPSESEDVDMGPVISREQQERVLGFLVRATEAKATILTGGAALGERGFFVKPTILADVTQDSEIVQDEVFGPVVSMQRFASDGEAIAMANDVRYGLAASVFSRDVARAMSAACKLEFGTVWINEHLFPLASEMPHGGFQGIGLRQGHVAVLDGGVHARQARSGEALVIALPLQAVSTDLVPSHVPNRPAPDAPTTARPRAPHSPCREFPTTPRPSKPCLGTWSRGTSRTVTRDRAVATAEMGTGAA